MISKFVSDAVNFNILLWVFSLIAFTIFLYGKIFGTILVVLNQMTLKKGSFLNNYLGSEFA